MTLRFKMARAALAAAIIAAAAPARAEVPASGVAQFNDAASAVTALIANDQANKTMPKFANPAERPALERLCDSRAILGAPPYGAQSLASLAQMMPAESKLLQAYIFFSPNHTGTVDGAALVEYQDEITRLMALTFDTWAATMPALADFVAHLKPEEVNDARRAGVRQMRGGFRQVVTGSMQMLASNAMRQDNQILLANSFRGAGVPLASAMTLADRAAIVQTVQDALPKLTPEVQAPLRGFIAAMGSQACEGLCKVE